ncbi:uncharacterized protein A4U43_C10F11900 [Asparagus officinalis]|uniref:Ubiquitin-like protease family profile domain-containing protein n=1 Tax=Asparagus officinalis TaxID=4686 RepID=A0A5P1E5G0_ASPOF|nr:uncharacterized protein A4U43_C10F11900 [Asparagus officinalis]
MKLKMSGGNCGNEAENETEGEEESDGDDEEDGGDDGDDEDDGGDDGDDGDDDNTNVGGNVVEDDKGNTGERGVQSNEEMGEDVERSEKSSGRSNSKRKGKQPEMIAEELIEDEDFLPISFSRTDEYVWQSVTRLDVYHLLIGSAISDSLVDGMIERFKMKIETEAYSKHIHITGSFFARALLEDNLGHWARLLKGRQLPHACFEDSEKIIFPILSSSHWHLLELIKDEKKIYHYSSLTYIKYLNDAKMFMNNFLACIKDEWKIKNVDEYSIETRQVAQQDGFSV